MKRLMLIVLLCLGIGAWAQQIQHPRDMPQWARDRFEDLIESTNANPNRIPSTDKASMLILDLNNPNHKELLSVRVLNALDKWTGCWMYVGNDNMTIMLWMYDTELRAYILFQFKR